MTGKVSSLERRWAWLAYGSSHRVLVEHAATLLSCSRDVPFILRMQESTALEISASGAQTRMPAHVGSRLRIPVCRRELGGHRKENPPGFLSWTTDIVKNQPAMWET